VGASSRRRWPELRDSARGSPLLPDPILPQTPEGKICTDRGVAGADSLRVRAAPGPDGAEAGAPASGGRRVAAGPHCGKRPGQGTSSLGGVAEPPASGDDPRDEWSLPGSSPRSPSRGTSVRGQGSQGKQTPQEPASCLPPLGFSSLSSLPSTPLQTRLDPIRSDPMQSDPPSPPGTESLKSSQRPPPPGP
jgi:hypothetical protein